MGSTFTIIHAIFTKRDEEKKENKKYVVNFFLLSTFYIWNYYSAKVHQNGLGQDTNFNFRLFRHFENEYSQFSSHNF